MSEIASKPYTEAGSSLAPPFAKKGATTEHDVMFAALFGGVVATQSDAEPLAAELNPAHADADADANPDGNTDILMAMQAVAAMLSGQPAKRQNSDLNAADGEAGGEVGGEAGDALPDALTDALTDAHGIASVSDQLDQEQLVNPAMIGPMPLQSQNGKFSDPSQPSGVLGKMAFEDEAPATPSRAAQTAASAPTQHPLPAGKTSLDLQVKLHLLLKPLMKCPGISWIVQIASKAPHDARQQGRSLPRHMRSKQKQQC